MKIFSFSVFGLIAVFLAMQWAYVVGDSAAHRAILFQRLLETQQLYIHNSDNTNCAVLFIESAIRYATQYSRPRTAIKVEIFKKAWENHGDDFAKMYANSEVYSNSHRLFLRDKPTQRSTTRMDEYTQINANLRFSEGMSGSAAMQILVEAIVKFLESDQTKKEN